MYASIYRFEIAVATLAIAEPTGSDNPFLAEYLLAVLPLLPQSVTNTVAMLSDD